MNKRQRNTSKKPNKSKPRNAEIQSEGSLGTTQLQEKASRTTENVFAQMLSRSK